MQTVISSALYDCKDIATDGALIIKIGKSCIAIAKNNIIVGKFGHIPYFTKYAQGYTFVVVCVIEHKESRGDINKYLNVQQNVDSKKFSIEDDRQLKVSDRTSFCKGT